MDVVKEDMAEVEVTEEDTEVRNNWRWKIGCGDPWWEKEEDTDSRTWQIRDIVGEVETNVVFLYTYRLKIKLIELNRGC